PARLSGCFAWPGKALCSDQAETDTADDPPLADLWRQKSRADTSCPHILRRTIDKLTMLHDVNKRHPGADRQRPQVPPGTGPASPEHTATCTLSCHSSY